MLDVTVNDTVYLVDYRSRSILVSHVFWTSLWFMGCLDKYGRVECTPRSIAISRQLVDLLVAEQRFSLLMAPGVEALACTA